MEKIINGGFEYCLANWTVLVEGVECDNSTKHSGVYSLKISGDYGGVIYQTFVPKSIEQIDTFGCWTHMPDGYPAYGTCGHILYEGWVKEDPYNEDTTTPLIQYGGISWSYRDIKESIEPSKGKVMGLLFRSPGAVDFWADDVSLNTVPTSTSYIIRPKSILIGSYPSDTYEWFGIKSIKWEDANPWVNTDIPQGPMLHQHIRSPMIVGEITVYDLEALHKAIFNTVIDAAGHKAVELSGTRKWKVEYCVVRVLNHLGEIVEYQISGFRIRTVSVENIELGSEASFIVKFEADSVIPDM